MSRGYKKFIYILKFIIKLSTDPPVVAVAD